MFRLLVSRVWDRCAAEIDELLAADFDLDDGPDPLAYHREHPHRARLHSGHERRPGGVPSTPAHCISPVRVEPQVRGLVLTGHRFDR